MTEKHTAETTRAVYDWLYRNGDYPGDVTIAAELAEQAQEWARWRSQGMDAVASGCRDVMRDIVDAMGEV